MTNRIKASLRGFAHDVAGEMTLKLALLVGGVAMAAAVVSAPMLDKATRTYAESRAFGIDRVLTGSVEKSKRYTITRSILTENAVCRTAEGKDCDN